MKNLTALIFSAAIVPALALSTTAFAQDRDDKRAGEMGASEERTGEQQAGEQRNDDMTGSKQQASEERAGEQQVGGQHMSAKPAGAFYADDLIGETVKHRGSDENIGEVQDLIIGEDGRVVGVVVQTGGFLGLGGQDVGLGWDNIQRTIEDDEFVLYTDMDEETLRNAPDYERD